jgi:hypothetical protein
LWGPAANFSPVVRAAYAVGFAKVMTFRGGMVPRTCTCSLGEIVKSVKFFQECWTECTGLSTLSFLLLARAVRWRRGGTTTCDKPGTISTQIQRVGQHLPGGVQRLQRQRFGHKLPAGTTPDCRSGRLSLPCRHRCRPVRTTSARSLTYADSGPTQPAADRGP